MSNPPLNTAYTEKIHGIPLVMVNSPKRLRLYETNSVQNHAKDFWQSMCLNIAKASYEAEGIHDQLPEKYDILYSAEINAVCEDVSGLQLDHFDILACAADKEALEFICKNTIARLDAALGQHAKEVREVVACAFQNFEHLRERLHKLKPTMNNTERKITNADTPGNTPAFSMRLRDYVIDGRYPGR